MVLVTAGDQRRHHAVVHVVVEGDKRARVPAGDRGRRPVRVVLLVGRDGTRSVVAVAPSSIAPSGRRR